VSTTVSAHLELRDVSYTYPGGPQVLDAVRLVIARGQLWSIVGPNGSGKSTLLRIMAGLIEPVHGQVLFNGRALSSLRPRERARRIAFLPQTIVPTFGYVARQIVAMGRYPHVGGLGLESRRDWQLVDEAMAWTDTSPLAWRTLNTLSGGERQRVVITAALVQANELLLLDEPTTGLDLHHQIGIHRLVTRLSRQRGWTVVTATHDLNLAAHFSQHVVMLKDGRVVASGAPAEVLTCRRVEEVYGVAMSSLVHPQTGAPVLVPAELGTPSEVRSDAPGA